MSKISFSIFGSRKAFTLIEVLVVVTVIAILVGIGVFGTTKYQQTTRDSERDAKANIIATSLEQYYDDNNEYPSCTALTASPSTVKSNTLKSLTDVSVLKAPQGTGGTNSITCAGDVPLNTDAFAYTCLSTTSCEEWELKYREESSGDIITISSAHTVLAEGEMTPLPLPTITIAAAMSGPNAVGTASATCTSGSPEFQIHHYVGTGSFPATWTNSHTLSVGISEGQSATFQAQARCVRSGYKSSDYRVSSNASVIRPVAAPTGLTTTAVVQGSDAVATVGGGTCSSGMTFTRQIRSSTMSYENGGSWSSYANIATTTHTVALEQGWQANFQQQARCSNPTTGVNSTWTEADPVSVVRPVTTIAAPSVSVSGNMSTVPYTWSSAVTCPSGLTKEFQYYLIGSWGGENGWNGPVTSTSYTWNSSMQGYTYTLRVQQRCSSGFESGTWSSYGSASYARPVATPGGATGFYNGFDGRNGISFRWTEPACGSATTQQWRADYVNGGGTGIKWVNAPTGREDGWWYGGSSANPSSALSTGSAYSGYLGDQSNSSAVRPPRMDLDVGDDAKFDTDNIIGVGVEYRCINTTSGVAGAFGPVRTDTYTWP